MSEEELKLEAKNIGRLEQHRFMLLVGLTILISLFLVGVALALYTSSGAAQLDLSRPGYQSVRDQATSSKDFTGFSANGALDKPALDEFRTLYEAKAKEATAVNSFSGGVMSDEALSIDDPAK